MRFRKGTLIFLFVLVLIALATGTWLWSTQSRLYSSPTAIRTNDSYVRAHAPGQEVPPLPTNFFSSIVMEQTGDQMQIWMPGSLESKETEYEPLYIHNANRFQSAQIGSGAIRLAYIGVAHAVIRTNIDWSITVPAQYYTPALEPVAADQTSDVIQRSDRHLQFSGDFPAAGFYFVTSNLANAKPLNFGVFDGRTQFPLTQGYSSSAGPGVFHFQSAIRLWHQTPLEVVVTVATGPAEEFTMPPRTGAELRYPGGVLRLLAAAEAEFGGTSTRSDGRTNHITLRATSGPGGESRPGCSFVFLSWPHSRVRGELEYHGANGEMFRTLGGGTSGHLIHSRVIANVEDVKEIRFRYLPNLHRISFTLPELPGLPEQNRQIENLFDVYVPAIHFHYEHAFQQDIAQLVQMQHSWVPLTFSNAFFPTIRTNTTARALFAEMASMLSNREDQLVADPEQNRIEARVHPVLALGSKLREKLGL